MKKELVSMTDYVISVWKCTRRGYW